MRIVTGRTSDPVPVQKWKGYGFLFLHFPHIVECSFFRLDEKMSSEKITATHGGVTSPEKEGYVGLKCHFDGVACLIGQDGVTHQTDGLPVDMSYPTLVAKHAVRINLCI